MRNHQKIIPNLWFDHQAEEAVEFYTSVFEDSAILITCRFPEAGQEIHQKEAGSVMTIEFELAGLTVVALNGGPHFNFNPSVSLFVLCKTEEEINSYWDKLLNGGSEFMPLNAYEWSQRYGWLRDRYGVSWQLMLDTEPGTTDKIVPLLFFTGKRHGKAEKAVRFYTSIFSGSGIQGILHYGDENTYAKGTVQHAQFQLEGQTFMAMDSGLKNDFPFNEAVSFIVSCKDQEEIDYYWGKLTEGGDPAAQQCGWLKDQFGISWQVIPTGMEKILNDSDRDRANLAMTAMMGMKKIDMDGLTKVSVKNQH